MQTLGDYPFPFPDTCPCLETYSWQPHLYHNSSIAHMIGRLPPNVNTKYELFLNIQSKYTEIPQNSLRILPK